MKLTFQIVITDESGSSRTEEGVQRNPVSWAYNRKY